MNTKALYTLTFLYWFSAYTFMPTLTPYLKDIGISYTMIGLIASTYGFAQLALRIPLGIASDLLRRRKMFIILGMFMGTISSVGFLFTENELLILICRFLSGMGAAVWVIIVVLFSSYFTPEQAPSRTSRLNMFNYLGQMLGTLSGAALAAYAGYKAPFMFSAVVAAAALIMSFIVEERVPSNAKAPPTLREMLQVGKNHRLLVMSMLATIVHFILSSSNNTFLPEVARNLGASTILLGYLTSIAILPRVLSSLFCGIILTKAVDERKLFIGAFSLMVVSAALTPLSPNLPFLFVVTFFLGFGNGMAFTLCLSLCTGEVDSSLKSTGMGFFQSIYSTGMTVGPTVVGIMVDFKGLTAGYMLIAGVAAIGLFIAVTFIKKKQIVA